MDLACQGISRKKAAPRRDPKYFVVLRTQSGAFLRLTAAAGQDQKSDDDDPDAVVVIEKIAEAVIHSNSSVSESVRGGKSVLSIIV